MTVTFHCHTGWSVCSTCNNILPQPNWHTSSCLHLASRICTIRMPIKLYNFINRTCTYEMAGKAQDSEEICTVTVRAVNSKYNSLHGVDVENTMWVRAQGCTEVYEGDTKWQFDTCHTIYCTSTQSTVWSQPCILQPTRRIPFHKNSPCHLRQALISARAVRV